ncbi:SDR family oxidoreductase [Piscibacillus salipiscarius]|uniref:SDR family oxidoreductase n=1 Tax=Piscibacillus salipiscarius TaxID=299480 RepID=UPI0034E1C444
MSINLIKQLIKGNSDVGKISLLVLPTMKTKAQEELTQLKEELNMGESGPKFELILGDITKPNLNIETETNKQLIDSVRYVFHLAAIYDLAVPKKLAYEVNVKGTANVNQWVKSLKNLKRYVYFSTAYVAGKRQGPILETELDKKQEFKNHYEHTKYEAEVLVEQLKESVPLTIIRPGVVVGHSNSGETTKFDGPYFLLNFFDRLRFSPIIPYLGKGEAEGNFVPINYIIDATIYLSHSDKGIGKNVSFNRF